MQCQRRTSPQSKYQLLRSCFSGFCWSFLWCKIVFCFTRVLQSFGFFSSKEGQLPMSSFRNLISTLVWDSNTELFSGRIVWRRNFLVKRPRSNKRTLPIRAPNPITAHLLTLIATSQGSNILFSTYFFSGNNVQWHISFHVIRSCSPQSPLISGRLALTEKSRFMTTSHSLSVTLKNVWGRTQLDEKPPQFVPSMKYSKEGKSYLWDNKQWGKST